MANESLRTLYIDELKDLYSAETQLVKALPKMAKAASSEELQQGFEQHLEQTKQHVSLLEQTLEEEKETDEKLSELASEINSQANETEDEEPAQAEEVEAQD